jgi:DNA (cytosine-5)-methyltransferase 1
VKNKCARSRQAQDQKVPFIDLFSGAGGLSCGFEMAGFESIYALDFDEFACETYAANHPNAHVCCDAVQNVSPKDIKATGINSVPLLIGGPNCQGVSLRGKRNPNDPKNEMFFHFKRLIEGVRPDWFVMENVPGLLHRHNQGLVTAIFEAFHSIGYRCGAEVLLAADYGVPQLRYRLVLIGTKTSQEIVFPDATHRWPLNLTESAMFRDEEDDRPAWLTTLDGISDLPSIENGGGVSECEYPTTRPEGLLEYQRLCRTGSDRLHNHVCHKSCDSNIRLIKYIKPGKNWKCIPEHVRPPRFKHVALKDHTTTYGRLSWDTPARTVTTYFNNISSGAFTHPEQHRGISVREGARLQGFPDRYLFKGTLARQYRQVGNAVPPLMASKIAQVIAAMINGKPLRIPVHAAAIDYCASLNAIRIHRPVQGMRFNLDKYLVRS